MNAQQVAERGALYALQDAVTPVAGDALELLATAPQGVARLRELILALALRGRLVRHDPEDEPTETLLATSRRQWAKLMAEGAIKRERPAAAVAAAEQRFPLPPNWTWCRVVDTAQYVNGLAFKPSDWGKIGRPIIRIQNLSGRNVDFHRTDKEVDPSVIVKSGDILVSWSATLDTFIWTGEEGVLNQHIFRVTPSPLVNRDFLYWLLKGIIRELAASDHAHGLVMSHINRGPFLAHPVATPPLAEQRRIVARVEELMGLCDEMEAHGRLQDEQHARLVATLFDALVASASPAELAENWQRVASHFDLLLDRPEAVDALEQTILQLAVRGLLVPQDPRGEPASTLLKEARGHPLGAEPPDGALGNCEAPFASPRGWERVTFDTVIECQNGYAFKSEWFKPHGTRLVRNVNVSHGQLDWTDTACVNEQHTKEFERFALAEGDIVLTLDRPIISTGLKLAEIQSSDLPCLLLQRVAKLTPRNGAVTHAFLMLWLRSSAFLDALDPGRSNGVPHISTKQVGAIPFGLPPLAEQRRIVARVDELRSLCADLRQHLQQAQTTQSNLADALVARTAA